MCGKPGQCVVMCVAVMHAYMHLCMHTWVYVYMCACMYICTCTCMHARWVWVHLYLWGCTSCNHIVTYMASAGRHSKHVALLLQGRGARWALNLDTP